MTSSPLKKLACVVVLCIVLSTMTNPHATAAAAVTCVGVTNSLAPCIAYLRGKAGPAPPIICCRGVQSLKGIARTPLDRKTACNCMKSAAGRIQGLNYGYAARLPKQCGVRIAYTFSPNTNCDTVQ